MPRGNGGVMSKQRYIIIIKESAYSLQACEQLAAEVDKHKALGWVDEWPLQMTFHGDKCVVAKELTRYEDDEFSGWTVTATGEVVT
jgi:hypothetical protein